MCVFYYLAESENESLNKLLHIANFKEYSCRGFFSNPRRKESEADPKIHFFEKKIEEKVRSRGLQSVFPELEEESYLYYDPWELSPPIEEEL
ncbi:hypothetical protein AB3N59_14095 [Leptospira sp. WS92.C1]